MMPLGPHVPCSQALLPSWHLEFKEGWSHGYVLWKLALETKYALASPDVVAELPKSTLSELAGCRPHDAIVLDIAHKGK